MMIFKTISFMLAMSQNEYNMISQQKRVALAAVNAGLLEVMV